MGLAERLMRRAGAPAGVIDVGGPQQRYDRAAGWAGRHASMLGPIWGRHAQAAPGESDAGVDWGRQGAPALFSPDPAGGGREWGRSGIQPSAVLQRALERPHLSPPPEGEGASSMAVIPTVTEASPGTLHSQPRVAASVREATVRPAAANALPVQRRASGAVATPMPPLRLVQRRSLPESADRSNPASADAQPVSSVGSEAGSFPSTRVLAPAARTPAVAPGTRTVAPVRPPSPPVVQRKAAASPLPAPRHVTSAAAPDPVSPDIVWRQPATAAAHPPRPLVRASLPLTIQRQVNGAAATTQADKAAPAAPPAVSTAAQRPSPPPPDVVEQVIRAMTRQLAIERERRGGR